MSTITLELTGNMPTFGSIFALVDFFFHFWQVLSSHQYRGKWLSVHFVSPYCRFDERSLTQRILKQLNLENFQVQYPSSFSYFCKNTVQFRCFTYKHAHSLLWCKHAHTSYLYECLRGEIRSAYFEIGEVTLSCCLDLMRFHKSFPLAYRKLCFF